jgi:hypothetical protein
VKAGLLLSLEETVDAITRYCGNIPDNPIFSTQCCETIFKQASGHAGAVISLVQELATVSDCYYFLQPTD